MGASLDSGTTIFRVGDDAADRQYRAILSFSTGGLPDNAIILSVQLEIRRAGLTGTDPFGTLGDVFVDVRKGSFNNNVTLEKSDFQAGASRNAAITITNNPVSNVYSGSMGSAYFGNINLTGPTQFRLRFAKDDNDNRVADFLKFYSGNFTTTGRYRPRLIITYRLP